MPANVRQCGIGGQWRRQAGFPPANAGGVWGDERRRRLADFQEVSSPFSWSSSAHHGGSIGGTLADFTPPQPGLAAASRGGRWPARRATLDRLRLCPAHLRRSSPMSAHGIGGTLADPARCSPSQVLPQPLAAQLAQYPCPPLPGALHPGPWTRSIRI